MTEEELDEKVLLKADRLLKKLNKMCFREESDLQKKGGYMKVKETKNPNSER